MGGVDVVPLGQVEPWDDGHRDHDLIRGTHVPTSLTMSLIQVPAGSLVPAT